MTSYENRNKIPEFPAYNILKYTKCKYCSKYAGLSQLAKDRGMTPDKLVFIEHYPSMYKSPDALKIMLVGESPGVMEMRKFRPFIGRSGILLRGTLKRIGYIRTEPPIYRILITNTVKCPCVGPPEAEVMRYCAGALAREADLFSPDLIIGLGRTAFHALTGKGWEYTLGPHRRATFEFRGFPVRLTYHPAAALHHINYRIDLNRDLKKYLEELIHGRSTTD